MTFFASLLGTDVLGLYMFFAEGGAKISFGIYDIARSLTIPGWIVISILLIQAVYLIAVGIERGYLQQGKAAIAPVRTESCSGAQEQQHRRSDQHQRHAQRFAPRDGRLFGLKEFAAHQGNTDISADEMEASKRALDRAIAVKTAELKRGLAGLATVGSTARSSACLERSSVSSARSSLLHRPKMPVSVRSVRPLLKLS
jgi:biopolymer transport protein ExbB/biopolymer transport protein TolQ